MHHTDRAAEVWVRCYQELGERLPPSCRGRCFPVFVREQATLAYLCAQLKLPLEEVDLALINSRSAVFSDILGHGDRVSLYPVFESFDIAPLTGLRRTPLRRLRFLADSGLEELADLLRKYGLRADTGQGMSRAERARISLDRGPVLLTRDPALVRDYHLEKAYVLKTLDPESQLREILHRFHLDQTAPQGSPSQTASGHP